MVFPIEMININLGICLERLPILVIFHGFALEIIMFFWIQKIREDELITQIGFLLSKGTQNAIEERLDRATSTPTWNDLFPNAQLTNLVAPLSDHNPIMVDTSLVVFVPGYRPFRFEKKWLEEPDLKSVITKCWNGFHDFGVLHRLDATTETLWLWGRHIAMDFRRNNEELELKIVRLLESTDVMAGNQLTKARAELAKLLLREEAHWR
ncbi:hypothetical protein ACS0TY_032980 [Phlomoides rotata]